MANEAHKDLIEKMERALGNTFFFYFKAHTFHWNVTGPTFSQLHAFFGDIYEDAHEAVDALAEHIRSLGDDAPCSIEEMLEYSDLKSAKEGLDAAAMIKALLADNDKVMDVLGEACIAAGKAYEVGVQNFLQDRIDRHSKWAWQLRATGGR